MRIIKLSKDEFPNTQEFITYINDVQNVRNPKGKFRIPKGYISQQSFDANETILFVQDSTAIGIGKSASRIIDNEDEYSENYPKYFILDVMTFEQINLSLYKLQEFMSQIGFEKNIVKTQGWPQIPEEYSMLVHDFIKKVNS